MLMIFDPVIPSLHIYLKEMISMNKKETDTDTENKLAVTSGRRKGRGAS